MACSSAWQAIAACCCPRSRWNMGGTALLSLNKLARKPGCHWTHGKPGPSLKPLPRKCLATAIVSENLRALTSAESVQRFHDLRRPIRHFVFAQGALARLKCRSQQDGIFSGRHVAAAEDLYGNKTAQFPQPKRSDRLLNFLENNRIRKYE